MGNSGTFLEMVVTKMKRLQATSSLALGLILLLSLFFCVGCDQTKDSTKDDSTGEVVVEPGVSNEPVQPVEDEEADDSEDAESDVPIFVDRGEASTLEDITANLALIDSYYFEQNVPYVDGHVYMQIWYKDGLMKLVTSVDGYGLSEYYYDYNEGTVINYAPGNDAPAMKMSFDPNGGDAPDNPKLRDYQTCTVEGFETVDRQLCMVLVTPEGSKLWVSTETGFPLQVYYEDSLGDLWTVQYKNIRLNDVLETELLLDPSVEVVDYTTLQLEPRQEDISGIQDETSPMQEDPSTVQDGLAEEMKDAMEDIPQSW